MELAKSSLKKSFSVLFCLCFGLASHSQARELMVAGVEITEIDPSKTIQPNDSETSNSNSSEETEDNEKDAHLLPEPPKQEPIPSSKSKGLISTPIHAEQPLKYQLGDKNLTKNLNKTESNKQFQLQGYINNKYVYLIVEKQKDNDQQVVGYMFDKSGNKKYVYGEWVNNSLQIYEPSNKRSTVQLTETPGPFAK
jgi:hypothetical protein